MALEIDIKKYYAYDSTIDRSFWVGAVGDGVKVDLFRGASGAQLVSETLSYEQYEEFRQTVPNARLPVFRKPAAESEAPPGNTIGHVVGPSSASAAAAVKSNPPLEPETQEEKGFWSKASDWVHGGLDVAGFAPGVGAIPDLINSGIYAAEGNYSAAAISAVAAVPGYGDAIKAGTMVGKAATRVATHTAKEAVEHSAEVAAREAAEKAAKEKAEREAALRARNGRDGMRSAGKRHQVPCFNPRGKRFKKLADNEQGSYLRDYKRQLRGHQDGINSMTASEFKAARDDFLRIGRNPKAKGGQQSLRKSHFENIRSDVYTELRQQGLGRDKAKNTAIAEAKKKLRSLAALHEPDMVAGGWNNPVPKSMGRADVNRSIGGSWNQKGRIAAIDKIADEYIESGRGDTKLNVALTPCPPGTK